MPAEVIIIYPSRAIVRFYIWIDRKLSPSAEKEERHNHQEESSCSVDHVVYHFQAGQRFAPIVGRRLPIMSPARGYLESSRQGFRSISPMSSLPLPTTRLRLPSNQV